MLLRLAIMACALWPSLVRASSTEAPPLKSYSLQRDRIFVAGVSSGGAMAMQLDVTYSPTFKAAAILPYDCAEGDQNKIGSCSSGLPQIEVKELERTTNSWAEHGLIDPLLKLLLRRAEHRCGRFTKS